MISIFKKGIRKVGLPLSVLFISTSLTPYEAVIQQGGLHVPEGFEVVRAVDPSLLSYPMFASFDETGRLFVFESTEVNNMGTDKMLANPTYHVRLLEDTDGDGVFDKSGVFADKIPLPMGGTFYKGSLYVAESPNLVKYTDTDNDGKADQREVLLSGWVLNQNAATLSGPFIGPDGWFYLPDARRGFDITSKEGKHFKGKGARIWRCRPDGTGLESMSGGGFDNAIEIAFMPSGESIGTMTYFMDPQAGFRDALMHWVEGGVYPKPNSVIQDDGLKLTGPLMPVMSKTARVAPSGLMRYQGSNWGKEYAGNLFSAEFNTGRVVRHVVSTDGASYSTVDTPFMTSSVADSHPTDVLQDADGSLLVLITGGWFIEGCPLSRVAKPDVLGGIFRIRKKGAGATQDPWGNKIDWKKQTTANLATLLKDKRGAVRARAADALAESGNKGIPALSTKVTAAADDEGKTEALFALSRIDSPEARSAVRAQLASKNAAVRTAAARILGLAKDAQSVNALMRIVQNDIPQVRRQAATALGQIGDRKALPALLKAAASTDDRFVEHAIIFSLIEMGDAQTLVKALSDKSDKTKKAALIALDQQENSALKKEHLPAFLESANPELRSAGIWVATHHPDWTDVVVAFLDKQLNKPSLSDDELIELRDLMVTFCKNEALQSFLARQLGAAGTSSERKLLYLSAIGKCDVRTLPSTWTAQLGELLGSKDPEILSDVLGLVQSRRVAGVESQLSKLVNDTQVSAALRLRAMSAKLVGQKTISAPDFDLATRFLGKGQEAPVRQATANLLVQASLSEQQLEKVASFIPDSDQFLLPALVEIFAGGKNETAGKRLVAALGSSSELLSGVSEEDLVRILSTYPASVRTEAAPVLENIKRQNAERNDRLAKLEKELPDGDVLEGRKLFFGKAGCSACHAVGNEGSDFGPDLTNIGDIRSRADILEAILYPSVSFAREHETVNVVTNGGTYMGIIKEQSADYIVVTPGPGADIRVNRNEIRSIEPHNVSMMPPGLDELLDKKEMSDLMTFMETLPYGLKRVVTSK
jgi:putative membrane-bound dehydrogenase-like protein